MSIFVVVSQPPPQSTTTSTGMIVHNELEWVLVFGYVAVVKIRVIIIIIILIIGSNDSGIRIKSHLHQSVIPIYIKLNPFVWFFISGTTTGCSN